MRLLDTLTQAEPGFREFLSTSTKIDWKLEDIEVPSSGETQITWKSERGKFILVAMAVTKKAAEVRLFYEDPRGMPEQPQSGRVALDKIGDPRTTIDPLLWKFKSKLP